METSNITMYTGSIIFTTNRLIIYEITNIKIPITKKIFLFFMLRTSQLKLVTPYLYAVSP